MSINPLNIFSDMIVLPLGSLKTRLNANSAVIIDAGAGWRDADIQPLLARCRDIAGALHFSMRIDDPEGADDALCGLISQGIESIVLAGCKGPAHLQQLDMVLRIAEAKAGLDDGTTRIIAEFGSAPEAFLPPRSIATASTRLLALSFNETAACAATGIAISQAYNPGSPVATMRASTLLMAAEARLPVYLLAVETANAAGFSGRIHRPAPDTETR